MRTYSLAEVAAILLPAEWTDGERWLARRLNRGELNGYRVGKVWRMTDGHLDENIRLLSNSVGAKPAEVQQAPYPTSVLDGLSRRSRARIKASA